MRLFSKAAKSNSNKKKLVLPAIVYEKTQLAQKRSQENPARPSFAPNPTP
jgi:hypothetical protein